MRDCVCVSQSPPALEVDVRRAAHVRLACFGNRDSVSSCQQQQRLRLQKIHSEPIR